MYQIETTSPSLHTIILAVIAFYLSYREDHPGKTK